MNNFFNKSSKLFNDYNKKNNIFLKKLLYLKTLKISRSLIKKWINSKISIEVRESDELSF